MTDLTNLDDDIQEHFEFILNSNHYKMRFPTTEEVEKADKLKTVEEQTNWMYELITGITPEAPPIKQALRQSNVMKAKAFNEMITKQLRG